MQIRLPYLEWLSIDLLQDIGITGPVEMDSVPLQNLYSVTNTTLCLYLGPWSGLIVS